MALEGLVNLIQPKTTKREEIRDGQVVEITEKVYTKEYYEKKLVLLQANKTSTENDIKAVQAQIAKL